MAASRSLSFTRSSSAPRTSVSPVAHAAATKNTGNSSMASGTSASETVMPRSWLQRTSMSATGSPSGEPVAVRSCTRISAPMRRSSSISPVRVGFTPTFVSVRLGEAARQPATMKNAAEEKSAGTAICVPRQGLAAFERDAAARALEPRAEGGAACARCDRATAPAR